jgi:hypothetical protein
MKLTDQMKRIIALCTVIGWVSVFGFSFSEVLESVNDKLESPDDELIERTLSFLRKTIFIWDEFRKCLNLAN